jgi:excinuclease ABC subunit C
MKRFGSLKRLRAATVEELMEVPGIGRRTAEAVQVAIAEPAVEDGSTPGAQESVLAPDGPAERGTPAPGSGSTAEVGRVAS